MARSIQICGTGSGVGKSLIVTGLCRVFLEDGLRVSPFKAQNMALNSFVTREGGEIGRAQATQAQASRIEPSVDMNPVLLKPASDVGSQVIVRGKSIGNMSAAKYAKYKNNLRPIVRESFRRLDENYDVVIIEGAGSPAEINLKSNDIVNMKMAEWADAPVILVGDIDRGGVFAWLVGTLELLTRGERKRIKGIIINKFRGDKNLLLPGINFLERRTGIDVLGVIPYIKEIKIPEEDSTYLDSFRAKNKKGKGTVSIDVIRLPHISNFTDFDALEKENDVVLRYVRGPRELNSPDVIIIPGTKNTISDLRYIKDSGLADKITSIIASNNASFLIGICGGYQMLGAAIYDRHSLESKRKKMEGLGILPLHTHLEKDKVLTRIKARELSSGLNIYGYEIHHGHSRHTESCLPAFEIFERNQKRVSSLDGLKREDGRILGTYIHGLFDADVFRRDFLNRVRQKKGLRSLPLQTRFNIEEEFDKLAGVLRENIDMDKLYKILNGTYL